MLFLHCSLFSAVLILDLRSLVLYTMLQSLFLYCVVTIIPLYSSVLTLLLSLSCGLSLIQGNPKDAENPTSASIYFDEGSRVIFVQHQFSFNYYIVFLSSFGQSCCLWDFHFLPSHSPPTPVASLWPSSLYLTYKLIREQSHC